MQKQKKSLKAILSLTLLLILVSISVTCLTVNSLFLQDISAESSVEQICSVLDIVDGTVTHVGFVAFLISLILFFSKRIALFSRVISGEIYLTIFYIYKRLYARINSREYSYLYTLFRSGILHAKLYS